MTSKRMLLQWRRHRLKKAFLPKMLAPQILDPKTLTPEKEAHTERRCSCQKKLSPDLRTSSIR
jgi:hypothetical protein